MADESSIVRCSFSRTCISVFDHNPPIGNACVLGRGGIYKYHYPRVARSGHDASFCFYRVILVAGDRGGSICSEFSFFYSFVVASALLLERAEGQDVVCGSVFIRPGIGQPSYSAPLHPIFSDWFYIRQGSHASPETGSNRDYLLLFGSSGVRLPSSSFGATPG